MRVSAAVLALHQSRPGCLFVENIGWSGGMSRVGPATRREHNLQQNDSNRLGPYRRLAMRHRFQRSTGLLLAVALSFSGPAVARFQTMKLGLSFWGRRYAMTQEDELSSIAR